MITNLLDEAELTVTEIRADYEGCLAPQWLCSGCGYGFGPDETGSCPKCHGRAREPANAFCEVPPSVRVEAATAAALLTKAGKARRKRAAARDEFAKLQAERARA